MKLLINKNRSKFDNSKLINGIMPNMIILNMDN